MKFTQNIFVCQKGEFKIHLQCKFKTLIIFMSLRKILYIFQAISPKKTYSLGKNLA